MGADIVQRIACKGVLLRDNKVLLLRESGAYEDSTKGGRYQLPGGRVNAGEPILEGLKREMFEETGLHVGPGEVLHVGEWFPVIRGVQNHIVGIFFACQSADRDIVLSNEHDDYIWVSADDIAHYDVIMPDKLAVIKALTGPQNT